MPSTSPCQSATRLKFPTTAGQGKIRAIINRTMPLGEVAQAHRIVENNQIAGKIILEPAKK